MPDPDRAGETDGQPMLRTVLYDLHLARGGRMVPFAGYEMPVRYEPGPIAEHQQCRTAAALFDVSHMGVVELHGPAVAQALEALVPAAITTLAPRRMRYTMLTNDAGGVIDDLMVVNEGPEQLTLVVNAGTKEADIAHLRAGLPSAIEVRHRDDLALLALQGPAAAAALARLDPSSAALNFLDVAPATLAGLPVTVSRSGYTGEDGFEITVAARSAVTLAEVLLDQPEVALAGLAARDSLRLEAGLCLYGHDLDPTTTPIEAGLAWTIQRSRRDGGGFPGAAVILGQLRDGPPRQRVGLQPIGRKPVRDGAELRVTADASPVGVVTSGGYGPTVGGPIAMAYVTADRPAGATPLSDQLVADVRGTEVPCRVVALPFVPHRYHRGS